MAGLSTLCYLLPTLLCSLPWLLQHVLPHGLSKTAAKPARGTDTPRQMLDGHQAWTLHKSRLKSVVLSDISDAHQAMAAKNVRRTGEQIVQSKLEKVILSNGRSTLLLIITWTCGVEVTSTIHACRLFTSQVLRHCCEHHRLLLPAQLPATRSCPDGQGFANLISHTAPCVLHVRRLPAQRYCQKPLTAVCDFKCELSEYGWKTNQPSELVLQLRA